MNETRDDADETASIESGDTVYDDDGRVLGIVTEFTDDGFAVEVVQAGADVTQSRDASAAAETDTEDIPGKDFGEGYLMWRCEDCGEMDDLDDGIPEECPSCGAPKEHIHMAQED